jgi:electron transfer flavoprotein alpha subunit
MNQDVYVVIEHLRGQVSDISYVMLAAGHKLTQNTGGEVVGVLLGQDVQDLTSNLAADRILLIEHPALAEFTPDAYQHTLSKLITENQPRMVLFGNTTIGAGVASLLSAELGLPLVGSCTTFTGSPGQGKSVSNICGGKILVESDLPDEITLVTMIPGSFKPEEGQSEVAPEVIHSSPPTLEDLQIKLAQYIEPEAGDVDITEEPILISIGRGIQTEDNLELAEELAEVLGGVVSASRPVVDQGWLPTSRMVGKSGQKVKAKLYLALGISGAPEHIEGITDCETIIAINTDSTAPIFDVANYGAEIDMLDLVEVLIEEIEEVKGE